MVGGVNADLSIVFLTYRAEGSLHARDASAAADVRAALDTALDSDAARCVDLVRAFIRRTAGRTVQPLVDPSEYARERLAL